VRVLPPSADSSKPTRHPEDETTLGAGEADVRGRFVLSSVPAVGAVGGEEHRLLVEAEGFLPTTETLPMAYEDGIQTTLVELARAHPFEIDVLVKAGDTPVAGARLVATSRHDWSELFAMQEPGPLAPGAETPLRGVTGPDGRARLGPFQGPARGAAVRVLVTHPNGPTARELSARPGPGPHRLAIQVGGADDFTRIVEGVVVLCDGDPAAGVPVRVEGVLKNGGAEVRTGADGRFRVPVPVDSWRIRASAPGFVSTTAEMAEVGADGLLRLVLEPGHVVTGRVVDREGAPVPWIDVAVFDEAVPHAELEFHALFTAHTSCIPLDIVETLLDGSDYVVSEPPVPPLREGSLTAPSPLQSAKTGADGRFRFFDLPATVGLCAAYVTGWEQRRPRSHAAVHVAARGEDEIEIRLDLLAPPGKPPESPPVDEGKRDVVVTLLGPETQRPHERGQSAWLLPDGQKKWIAGAIEGFGRVRFPAIPVGSCRYWADGRDIRVVDCVLEIPNGDGAFETTVRTEPCATVVVLLEGEPVDARDVTLELRPATGDNENWYRAYATEGDRLVAGGAPAGRYWLNAWVLGRPELTTALPYGIDVPEEGTVQTTLRLVRGGRVLLNVDRTAAPPVRDSDGDLCATWPACRARIVDAGGTLRWCGDLAMAREYSPDANDALVRRTQIVDIVLPPGGYTAFLEASGADVASGGFDLRRDACTSVVVAFPSPR
jgi:hypothetical protein